LDLLIVGGGATGAGVAVDAASRGLKVALVEMDDFSSGMAPIIDSYFKSLVELVRAPPQGPRQSQQSSSMGAFVTCKRQ
jgi:heterodisulfide reductase subunit A-like polyferredoxin